jgi:hypothetical protein
LSDVSLFNKSLPRALRGICGCSCIFIVPG